MLIDVRDRHSLLIALGYYLSQVKPFSEMTLEDGIKALCNDLPADDIRCAVDYMSKQGKRQPIEGGW